MYHIAHNNLIDYYRRQKHGVPLSFDEDGPSLESMPANETLSIEEHLDKEEAITRLRAMVEQLPEAQREVFLLKEEAGLSLHDIASVTGVNVETAKSRLRYAHKKLVNGMRGES
jgi:RNA polymerase sigma-70 factor (ECF subfamily)